MEHIEKIVEFDKYCKDCEFKDKEEHLDPCHECLNNPTNTYSRKPVNFKKKEVKKKVKQYKTRKVYKTKMGVNKYDKGGETIQ